MKIKHVERIVLDVPFHDVPARNMERSLNGWHICQICRVESDTGLVGIGETLPHYTWSPVTDEAVRRVTGANPFDLMWDDTLGAGLQMALFDIAGKAAGVPVHRLLGSPQVRQWCPLSWWGIDMSPQDFAAEARDAVSLGYRAFKQKARPWWDVYTQAKLTADAVPPDFKLDFDFNEMLVSAATAIPVLQRLETCPNMALFESPILHGDYEGYQRLRAATSRGVAVHFDEPDINAAQHLEICDGYVVGGGVSNVIRAASLAEYTHKLFWLQMVGTGITTAMALHLGAVCRQAQWPAVTCMNIYTDPLINEPMPLIQGTAQVPDRPGLGVTFNEEALKWRVDTDAKPNVEAIYAIVRASGTRTWYSGEYGPQGYWNACRAGNEALDEGGVELQRWDRDGSSQWETLAQRVKENPVREGRTV